MSPQQNERCACVRHIFNTNMILIVWGRQIKSRQATDGDKKTAEETKIISHTDRRHIKSIISVKSRISNIFFVSLSLAQYEKTSKF